MSVNFTTITFWASSRSSTIGTQLVLLWAVQLHRFQEMSVNFLRDVHNPLDEEGSRQGRWEIESYIVQLAEVNDIWPTDNQI